LALAAEKLNELLLLRGGWMKPVTKLKGEWGYFPAIPARMTGNQNT